MGVLSNLVERVHARLSGFPREWLDRGRLADWEAGHASVAGDVWAVSPPCGEGWKLWAPGSANPADDPFPYEGCSPAATHAPLTSDSALWLADVRGWLQPWAEEVSGGWVVDMVEGLAWFGEGRALSEYVIYARVAPR